MNIHPVSPSYADVIAASTWYAASVSAWYALCGVTGEQEAAVSEAAGKSKRSQERREMELTLAVIEAAKGKSKSGNSSNRRAIICQYCIASRRSELYSASVKRRDIRAQRYLPTLCFTEPRAFSEVNSRGNKYISNNVQLLLK
jgi:hypothetical protein